MTTIIDPLKQDIEPSSPRTYALKIEYIEEDDVVATFYKFGHTKLSVKKRFSKDSEKIRITIQKIWQHHTIEDAKKHEEYLFERYRPSRIFDNDPILGKTQGILLAGGNTELFLSNRLEGEKDIKLPYAIMMVDGSFHGHLNFFWQYLPPNRSLYSGRDNPKWLDWLSYVPENYLLLPEESHKKKKLVFVREHYLFEGDYFAASNRKRASLQEEAIYCDTFSEALKKAWLNP